MGDGLIVNDKKISLIIRCKNESKWIKILLQVLKKQSYKNYELIFCDNLSEDNSLDIIKKNNVKKIVKIKDYTPGYSINRGVQNARGKYIVVLSAHCIPSDNDWLKKLVKFLEINKSLVAAYGKQVPLPNSNPKNTIDLCTTFRDEKIIFSNDPYFNNANAIYLTNYLKKNLFDSKITNIEDQLWAKKAIRNKKLVGYCPEASVFQLQGIHKHDSYSNRSDNTKKIIYSFKNLKKKWKDTNFLKEKFYNYILLINSRREKDYKILEKKLNSLLKLNFIRSLKIKNILIITDLKIKKNIKNINLIIIKPKKNLSDDLKNIYISNKKLMIENNYCIAINSYGNIKNNKIFKLVKNGIYNTVTSITFAKKFSGNFILDYPDGGYFKSISLEELNKKSKLTLINWTDGVMLDIDNLRLGTYIDKDVMFV